MPYIFFFFTHVLFFIVKKKKKDRKKPKPYPHYSRSKLTCTTLDLCTPIHLVGLWVFRETCCGKKKKKKNFPNRRQSNLCKFNKPRFSQHFIHNNECLSDIREGKAEDGKFLSYSSIDLVLELRSVILPSQTTVPCYYIKYHSRGTRGFLIDHSFLPLFLFQYC